MHKKIFYSPYYPLIEFGFFVIVGTVAGIYGFLDTIKQASEILTNYHNECFDANDDTFESRFDSLFHKHNPYLSFDC